MQIKVTGDPGEDIAIVKAVRRAVGDDVNIFPDVNRGYRNLKPAIEAVRAMHAEAGICGVEQPVEGIEAMAQFTRAVDVPVIVDEGCWSPQDAVEIVRRGAADILSIYYTKSGGTDALHADRGGGVWARACRATSTARWSSASATRRTCT